MFPSHTRNCIWLTYSVKYLLDTVTGIFKNPNSLFTHLFSQSMYNWTCILPGLSTIRSPPGGMFSAAVLLYTSIHLWSKAVGIWHMGIDPYVQ